MRHRPLSSRRFLAHSSPARQGRRLVLMLWISASAVILWGLGFLWFWGGATFFDPPLVNEPTDAIIVLTGGSDRLVEGVSLLRQHLGKALLVSGVHPTAELDDVLRPLHLPDHDIPCCIFLDHHATNTEMNALKSIEWMTNQNFRSFRLVTADYHMQRALLEFHRFLPTEMTLIPVVVHPQFPPSASWRPWTPRLFRFILEYNKFLLAWVRAQWRMGETKR